jgi:hypothetical protein
LSKYSILIILRAPKAGMYLQGQARKLTTATILYLKRLKMRGSKREARRRAISLIIRYSTVKLFLIKSR